MLIYTLALIAQDALLFLPILGGIRISWTVIILEATHTLKYAN